MGQSENKSSGLLSEVQIRAEMHHRVKITNGLRGGGGISEMNNRTAG